MKWLESRILWGSLLVLGGFLFLLQNLGLAPLGNLYWSLLLGLAGIFFFSIFLQIRENWWALIPVFTLFSIAIALLLNWLTPQFMDVWGGSLLLAGISLGFFSIYLVERQLWWTLIPTGVLVTLAVVSGFSHFLPSLPTSGIFFLGMGLTFGMLGMLTDSEVPMNWVWIPTIILLLLGFVFLFANQDVLQLLWPAGLILIGLLLIFRSLRSR